MGHQGRGERKWTLLAHETKRKPRRRKPKTWAIKRNKAGLHILVFSVYPPIRKVDPKKGGLTNPRYRKRRKKNNALFSAWATKKAQKNRI